MSDPIDVYLTDRDLAARYRVHRTTPWQWISRHGFPPPVRLAPRCSRWRMADVLEWEKSREEVA